MATDSAQVTAQGSVCVIRGANFRGKSLHVALRRRVVGRRRCGQRGGCLHPARSRRRPLPAGHETVRRRSAFGGSQRRQAHDHRWRRLRRSGAGDRRPATTTVELLEPTPPFLEPGIDLNAAGSFTLWLCYREDLTDYATTGSASHSQDECEAGTIVESYAFRLTRSTPEEAESDLGERFRDALAHDPGEPAPDPKVVLCHLTQEETAEPPQDEGIPIATVEILDGQHLGAVDQCGVRARICSQATLLEIVSCLVSEIDERLSEIPTPSGGRP